MVKVSAHKNPDTRSLERAACGTNTERVTCITVRNFFTVDTRVLSKKNCG